MRSILLAIFFTPGLLHGQVVDIYSKWTSYLDEKTQIILDLSDRSNIRLAKITLGNKNKFEIDSFGFKRYFNIMYMDLDSSIICWSGSLAQIYEEIETPVYHGIIEVTEKNIRGIPQKIKFSGEAPELSIYLNYDDTIEFKRMVLKDENETAYSYPTHYGGEISYTLYTDGQGGFSMGLRDIGMQYEIFGIKKPTLENLNKILTDTINMLRVIKGIEPLKILNTLNEASSNSIREWLNEAQRKHQLKICRQEVDKSFENYIFNETFRDGISFLHYPFRCGVNAVAISIINFDISNKNKFNNYINTHTKQISQALFSELMENKGEFQNIFNQGYSTMGSSFLAVEANKNDFYFDESGIKVDLKNKKEKYYYLLFVQSFSIYD